MHDIVTAQHDGGQGLCSQSIVLLLALSGQRTLLSSKIRGTGGRSNEQQDVGKHQSHHESSGIETACADKVISPVCTTVDVIQVDCGYNAAAVIDRMNVVSKRCVDAWEECIAIC